MPTYEYECRSCKKRFDRFQQMTAKPTAVCPKCKGSARRLISGGAGVLFKGSGFYATDYRSSGYKKQAATECKKGKPTEGGCENGPCAKPSKA